MDRAPLIAFLSDAEQFLRRRQPLQHLEGTILQKGLETAFYGYPFNGIGIRLLHNEGTDRIVDRQEFIDPHTAPVARAPARVASPSAVELSTVAFKDFLSDANFFQGIQVDLVR